MVIKVVRFHSPCNEMANKCQKLAKKILQIMAALPQNAATSCKCKLLTELRGGCVCAAVVTLRMGSK